MAIPLSNLTATWATSSTSVNNAIKINVTDIVSANNSKLLDLQVNENSKFSVAKTGELGLSVPLKLKAYTVATRPPAADFPGCIIYVSDGTASNKLQYSDGTNWISAG